MPDLNFSDYPGRRGQVSVNERPSAYALNEIAAAIGGGTTLTTVEVSLGTNAKMGGKFTISGSGMTVGKAVLISQAVGPYTGKGTRADEAEMDQVSVTAKVTDATTITAYWTSARRVRGNFKFNYQVSA